MITDNSATARTRYNTETNEQKRLTCKVPCLSYPKIL